MSNYLINQFESNPNGFYFFNKEQLIVNYQNLFKAFSSKFKKFTIAYSFKTNYTPLLCKLLKENGAMAEVVSDMEMQLALKLGYTGDKIIYNGPFKSQNALKYAILSGVTIHIDSLDELNRICSISKELDSNHSINLGIRINFDIENEKRSRFGIDIKSTDFKNCLSIIKKESFNLKGIHCHYPFRTLNTFKDRIEKLCSFCNNIDLKFDYIDIGGGFYSPMPKELSNTLKIDPPNYNDYASIIYKTFQNCWKLDFIPRLIIEPGSALVANVFDFYTKVVSIKNIDNTKIATLSGSKFNILPNSSKHLNLPIQVFNLNKNKEKIEINKFNMCGYTCIESDILYENYVGELYVDDIIVFKNVGSYSIVMKPPFILPNYPILTKTNSNSFVQVKFAETFEYIFQNFNFNL
jgi:diaminopimelate decarboxylase